MTRLASAGGGTAAERSDRRLAAALDALRVDAVAIAPLAGLAPATRTQRTYRVTTAGGDQLKVRVARRQDRAARSATLIRALADPRVPSPVARVERLTAERWVDGEPLSALTLTDEHVVAAARLLASIHRFTGVAPERLPTPRRTTPLARRVQRQLTQLVDSGTLAPDAASELAAILDRDLPPVGTWGLTHGDFSAENIVVRPDGALVSVDNELVSRGFIEWDVARRWYRWPMPAWAEERFATAYVDAGGPAVQSQRSERAWRIAAAVKGVHLRTRLGGSLERGLDTLQLLLAVPTPT